MRHAIGALMSRSKKTIPHYYLSATVDLRAAVDWMQSVNAQRPVATRLVPPALLLKAAALAALETPEVNGFFIDGKLRPSGPVALCTLALPWPCAKAASWRQPFTTPKR